MNKKNNNTITKICGNKNNENIDNNNNSNSNNT